MVFDTWFGIFVPLFLEYKAELHKTHTVGGTTLTESQVDAILSALVFYGVAVPIYYQLRPHLKDENDNMVFECAGQIPAKIGAYAAPAVHEGGIPRLPPP